MKNHLTIYVLAGFLVLGGCASHQSTKKQVSHQRCCPDELSLKLTLDQNSDLLLHLKNGSGTDITNSFSQALFEGKFFFIQLSRIPAEAYPKDYLNLLVTSIWSHDPYMLKPKTELAYRVAVKDLVFPLSDPPLEKDEPIYIYAILDPFEIVSNVIELNEDAKKKLPIGIPFAG